MKGKIKVIVSTKKLRYELNLRRNITILQGDSATGKTTLIQILSDYLAGRSGPGTEVLCPCECTVLAGDTESVVTRLKTMHQKVVFADEQDKFLYTRVFAEAVLESDCYFVLVVRDGLHMLPYSVNEIYCLRNCGYYQNTRQIYNSMEQIYPELKISDHVKAEVILTEDSNAGHEMYTEICKPFEIQCISAGGKSNIAKYILQHKNQNILAVVDGASFGADMQDAVRALISNPKSHVWTPESFEYLLLNSGILQAPGLKEILAHPEDHIESGEYCSWERYFTHLLEEMTQNTIYSYSKKKLNPNYLTKGNLYKYQKLLPSVYFEF